MTVGICVVPEDACDLFNDMCPANERCFPTTIGLQCLTGGGIAAGADCNDQMPQQCDAGLYCADLDGAGPSTATCRTLCAVGDGSQCTGTAVCQAVFQDLPTLGLCINPP